MVRTTYCNKRWRLVTSIARLRELSTFYNFKKILDNVRENKNQNNKLISLLNYFHCFFWSIIKKKRENRCKEAWRKDVYLRKVLPLSKSFSVQFLCMKTFPFSVSDGSVMISQ